jgi:hypothetical protein
MKAKTNSTPCLKCWLILIIANEDKQMMRQKSSSTQSKGLFVLGEADISPSPVPDVKFLTRTSRFVSSQEMD